MSKHINLVKLCVGAEAMSDLAAWQKERYGGGHPRHVTRMWPKRSAEILAGGSLYWVIKGTILCRQRIADLQEVTGADGIRRCAIILEPGLIRTTPAPRRPFQGWRYLTPEDAPKDLTGTAATEASLPPDLQRALSEIGVL
ncbi:MAG: DUF1489 domain-containing protein [Pseudomonadota bacterium]